MRKSPIRRRCKKKNSGKTRPVATTFPAVPP